MQDGFDKSTVLQNVFGELAPDYDVKKIPSVYEPKQFKEIIKSVTDRELMVISDKVLGLNNEFMVGVGNVLVSELAKRIKECDRLFAVNSLTLAKPYPYIRLVKETVAFLTLEEGERYIRDYNEKHSDKLALETIEKSALEEYFIRLTRFGIEYLAVEPTLCKIRYKQNQLINTAFDSVTGSNASYLMLRFLQSTQMNNGKLLEKGAEVAMLAAIATGTFVCMGLTIDGRFEAVLIGDKRSDDRWIPIFTDTAEIQETYTTIPAIAKMLMTSETVTMKFYELRRYMDLEKVSGIVINIGGYSMKLSKEKCIKLMGGKRK